MMYVFGGQAPKAISTIEVYDFRSQKWSYHNDMPTKRCRAGYEDESLGLIFSNQNDCFKIRERNNKFIND